MGDIGMKGLELVVASSLGLRLTSIASLRLAKSSASTDCMHSNMAVSSSQRKSYNELIQLDNFQDFSHYIHLFHSKLDYSKVGFSSFFIF